MDHARSPGLISVALGGGALAALAHCGNVPLRRKSSPGGGFCCAVDTLVMAADKVAQEIDRASGAEERRGSLGSSCGLVAGHFTKNFEKLPYMAITTSENDIKERLSIAYVTAVAARAGCQVVSLYVDKLSIDAMIRPVSGSAALVDLQLKATSQSLIVGLEVVYDLPIKNYDDLRASETNPHYLVILHLSGPAKDWLEVSVDELLLRGTAYWGNLHGLPSSSNSTTQRIKLPDTQRLTVDVIESMINQAPARIGRAGI